MAEAPKTLKIDLLLRIEGSEVLNEITSFEVPVKYTEAPGPQYGPEVKYQAIIGKDAIATALIRAGAVIRRDSL
jgi:hypothetical protein